MVSVYSSIGNLTTASEIIRQKRKVGFPLTEQEQYRKIEMTTVVASYGALLAHNVL